MPVFHFFGVIALAIYIVTYFFGRRYYVIATAAVDLLFALMFGTLQAFAPMVIYLFNALFVIVPPYRIAAKLRLSPKLHVLIFQGIPAVVAISVGLLATQVQNTSPFGVVITFAFPVVAILLNLVMGFVSASGKSWSFAPLVRSLIWIVYFIVAGIWVSIVYEIFNLVMYISILKQRGELPTIQFKKRERPAKKPRPKRERAYRPIREPKRARHSRPAHEPKPTSVPAGNNTMSFGADNKNAALNPMVPMVIKGQW